MSIKMLNHQYTRINNHIFMIRKNLENGLYEGETDKYISDINYYKNKLIDMKRNLLNSEDGWRLCDRIIVFHHDDTYKVSDLLKEMFYFIVEDSESDLGTFYCNRRFSEKVIGELIKNGAYAIKEMDTLGIIAEHDFCYVKTDVPIEMMSC